MSSTLPVSASPKAIDMWFFYCILRLFLFFVSHCIVNFYYKKATVVAKKENESVASSKQEEAPIPLKAASYKSLNDPSTAIHKLENDEIRQRCQWMTEDKSSTLLPVGGPTQLPPELVNKISLFFGVAQDIIFVVAFWAYLEVTNNSTTARFENFRDCSQQVL